MSAVGKGEATRVMRRDILYPPVGIAHVVERVSDLARRNHDSADVTGLIVSTSAQPNGPPHLGTASTILSVFAVAAYLRAELGLSASVLFDSIDNAPASTWTHEGVIYALSLLSTPAPTADHANLADHYFESLRRVLDFGSAISEIAWSRRPYTTFQASEAVRRRLLTVVRRQSEFGALLNPRTSRVHVRIPCERCHYVDKHSVWTIFRTDNSGVTIRTHCPRHGWRAQELSLSHPPYLDLNTPLRDVLKCAEFSDWRSQGSLVVMVDGADWGGAWVWEIVMKTLATLGEDLARAPVRLFAPMILDESGAKFSKSLYVGSDAYASLPPWVVDLTVMDDAEFRRRMSSLWRLVQHWVGDPRRFFRDYSLSAVIAAL